MRQQPGAEASGDPEPSPRRARSDAWVSELRPTDVSFGSDVSSWLVLGHRTGVSGALLMTPGFECFCCFCFKKVGVPAVVRRG